MTAGGNTLTRCYPPPRYHCYPTKLSSGQVSPKGPWPTRVKGVVMARTNWPRPKQSSTARGYGAEHRRLRNQWAPHVATGTIHCARCGKVIPPGAPWHLGHTDDRTAYTGPEHAHCNVRDGARRGNARSRRRPWLSKEW